MGLRESVLEIATEMESVDWDEHMSCPTEGVEYVVKQWVKQLRLVVKASEGQPVSPPSWNEIPPFPRRAKEDGLEIKVKEQAQKEEAFGELITEIADGPLEGDNIMRPASMPVGAKTEIAGSVYELKEDHRLHHVPK